jgi:hypothetical protein
LKFKNCRSDIFCYGSPAVKCAIGASIAKYYTKGIGNFVGEICWKVNAFKSENGDGKIVMTEMLDKYAQRVRIDCDSLNIMPNASL